MVNSDTLIHGLMRDELEAVCREMGQPTFRARQIWRWLYVQRTSDWAEMVNIPKAFRAELAERFRLDVATPVRTRKAADGTRKIVAQFPDDESIEEVLIPAPGRRTVCISSQCGCKFRCAFCASGQAGFRRNLVAAEMVGQVLLAAGTFGDRPSHVVFMGIGEPLDNYDEVLKAVRIINDKDGLGIGARRITISTCGLISGIDRLAGAGLQIELSVSLHAPADSLRSTLMPVNRNCPLEDLLAACKRYSERTGRIITFEYTLIADTNDSFEQAQELARILTPLPCRVNLIPLSPVEEFAGRPPPPEAAEMFIRALQGAGINATLRMSKGCALKAACGQLRYGKGED